MSKMDGLRAMREARYDKAVARSAKSKTRAAPEKPTDLCGHRNMSGRTCTREKGHAAKSHRYGAA